LEVAEHLPQSSAKNFVTTLTNLGDIILFSAAIPMQPGTNHINNQFPNYWVNLFSDRGYKCIDCLRDKFWQDPQVEWWYSQNMLLFVNEDFLRSDQRLHVLHHKTDFDRIVRIHPKNLFSKIAFGHDDNVELGEDRIIDEQEADKNFNQKLVLRILQKSTHQNFSYTNYSIG